jgi:hypothetical protein
MIKDKKLAEALLTNKKMTIFKGWRHIWNFPAAFKAGNH